MKFLEAQKLDGKVPKASLENKMRPGTRIDQKDPRTLVSDSTGPLLTGHEVDPGVTKLAQELGVDLATVTGTGVSGRIMERDVRKAKKDQHKKADEKPGSTDK